MKRRDFLTATSVGLAGALIPDFAKATPCPPPAVGLDGTSANTACSSSSAQADWLARINQPGVVWYHNFDSAAEVNAFRWTGSYGGGNDPLAVGSPRAPATSWVATGGADGGGYLQLLRPAGIEENSHWWRPFSPIVGAGNGRGVDDPGANGTLTPQSFVATNGGSQGLMWTDTAKPGWYGNAAYQNSFFDGTDFYLQVRVMTDPRRTTPGNIQVGKKVWITTTANSYTEQELVTYGGSFDTAAVGAPNYHNMYQGHGYDPLGNGRVWAYATNGTWDTLLYHITPGLFQGTGANQTRIEVWAAHAGQTSYTKIRDQLYSAWFEQGTPTSNSQRQPWQNGWNALILSSYSNGPDGSPPCSEFWERYDQVIFSKNVIACPAV